MAEPEIKRPVREPSLFDSILPLIVLVALIGGAIALFGLHALDGPIPAALMVCAMVAALLIVKNGHPWEEIQKSGQRALTSITTAIFILLAVGALIGTWCPPPGFGHVYSTDYVKGWVSVVPPDGWEEADTVRLGRRVNNMDGGESEP